MKAHWQLEGSVSSLAKQVGQQPRGAELTLWRGVDPTALKEGIVEPASLKREHDEYY